MTSSTSKSIAFWMLAVLIGAAPLAFGSVETWSEAWLRFGAVAAFAAAMWSAGPASLFKGAAGRVVLPVVLLILWGLLQSLPLPGAVVRALSPRTAVMHAATVPPGGSASMESFLLSRASAYDITVDGSAPRPTAVDDRGIEAARSSLSINPNATRRACLAWLTPLLLGVAADRLARDPARRYRLLWIVGGWVAVLGMIAVAQTASWNGKILWMRETPGDAMPLGPFVNPNHFAGYVEMGVFAVFGLMLAISAGSSGRVSFSSVRQAVLDKVWAFPRLVALAAMALLAIAGLALSGSRGGAIAMLVGIAVMIPWLRARVWLPAACVAVLVFGVGVGYASSIGPEQKTLKSAFFTRGVDDASLSLRSDIWGRTWHVLADNPIVGTGLGTFPWAYPAYDREGEWLGTIETHNDYLQLAAETGIVGIVLLGWLVVALGFGVMRPALRASHSPRWTTVALAASVFAMLVHSILEFNLQIPAVAALFAVMAGLLTAAVTASEGETAS